MDDFDSYNNEEEKLRHRLGRVEKQNALLEAYNRDLLDQVKLLTAKLQLARQFLFQNASTQTDKIQMPFNAGNDDTFINQAVKPATPTLLKHCEITKDYNLSTTSFMSKHQADIEELIKDMKQSSDEVSKQGTTLAGAADDYCYDDQSKTYYSKSTGCYYYPEQSAFYNPSNQSYYRYDALKKKHEFMYSLTDDGQKDNKKTTASPLDKASSSQPDQHIFTVDSNSSSDENVHRSNTIQSKKLKQSTTQVEEEEEGEIIDLEDEIDGDQSDSERKGKYSSHLGPTAMIHFRKRSRTMVPNARQNSISRITNQKIITAATYESKPFLRRHLQQPLTSANNAPQKNNVLDESDETEPSESDDESGGRLVHRAAVQVEDFHVPPVRLIVQAAEQLDIGSLLLISCVDGKIGQHSRCTITIPDATISQIHAEVTYDRRRRCYMLQDLCSRNGTYQNGVKLETLQRNALFHGDVIQLADSVRMLAHIHQHRDFVCDQCTPRSIVAQTANNYYTKTCTTLNESIKNLKKKYGLNTSVVGFNTSNGIELPSGYTDRAAIRKKQIGSDNPYEKTAAGSALDMPLDQSNKGFQMMQKMGWKSGQGLGDAQKSLNVEPLQIELRNSRQGLGFL